LETKDLQSFHAYRSDDEVVKYQGFDTMSMDEAADFILNQTDNLFGKPGEWSQHAIELTSERKLIGDCALRLQKEEPRFAEIGITIAPDEQQKGYGKEVLLALMSFLFKEMEVLRIVEILDAENTASQKLLESTGFRKEGHFIRNIFFKGNWGSEFQYALLKSEWQCGVHFK
jgi:RimJ/RimL family protein N-acetyltransferase